MCDFITSHPRGKHPSQRIGEGGGGSIVHIMVQAYIYNRQILWYYAKSRRGLPKILKKLERTCTIGG